MPLKPLGWWWSSAGDPSPPERKTGWSEWFKKIGRSDCRCENSRVLSLESKWQGSLSRIGPFSNADKGLSDSKVNAQMRTHKTWKDIHVVMSSCEHLSKPVFQVNAVACQVSAFWIEGVLRNHLDVWSCPFHRRIACAKSNCFQASWN